MTSNDKLLENPCAKISSDSDFDHANRVQSPWAKQKVVWYKPSERMPEDGDDVVLLKGNKTFRGITTSYNNQYKQHITIFNFHKQAANMPEIFNYVVEQADGWTYASTLNLPNG
jgi:hypothetical protein